MEERVNVALSANEMNFIIDAIDSYHYVIKRLLDDNAKGTIDEIANSIFMNFKQSSDMHNSMMQAQADGVEPIVIDVEPEVIPNEE